MGELVPGGNVPLPAGPLSVRVPGPFDVSALITGEDGRVRGDADFVFFNQPAAPGARLRGDTLTVDPAALRPGATRVTVVVSPADPGTPLGRLPSPTLRITGPAGRTLARFTPPHPREETVLLLVEIYRRGDTWKARALGQGYGDGLAGLARDFGVDVVEDAAPATTPFIPSPRSPLPVPPAPTAPPVPPSVPPRPSVPPGPADADGFAGLVNASRAQVGCPPVALDARLSSAARGHAAAMASAGRLGVEGGDGVSVYQRVVTAGFAYLTVAEHLVSGPRTPAEFITFVQRDEQLRRSLQDPSYTHAGLGHATGNRTGDVFWTALWARPFTPAGLARTAAEVVGLTNRERLAAGLRPLAPDPPLTAAAQAHSADMVGRDFYSHTAPDGGRPWDRAEAAGARRRSIGENIACGQRSAAEVVTGWMNSPGHRANILKPDFTHIGIGLAGGGRAGMYWTQVFGA
ncbi:CAP domain-containing protein [Streptomyces sp. NPDC091377]|uniref:CAP domain-containing protein n=1 Tax=Streptomyces sp. NPDC091377 TaxID=3365995 RepID=UPI003809AA2C